MKLIPVESSMISAVGYDAKEKELEVVFNTGAVWRYHNVPQNVYEELMDSSSKGSYLRDLIMGQYPDKQVRRRR
jgi:hypothetical protein